MADLTPHDIGWFESADELRDWLEAHHATAPEKWVGTRPKASGLPTRDLGGDRRRGPLRRLDRRNPQAGRRRLGAAGSRPGASGSVWSARNVGRVEALRAAGRMRPAGEAAFGRRRDDRTAIYSFEGNWAFDEAADTAMRRDAAGWAFWEAQPPGYRRLATQWVMSAKRPETRERRVAQLVEACTVGERLPVVTGAARPPAKP